MQAPLAKERFSVLLVDDDPMVIRILSHILSDYAPLRFATSGRVALKLAREAVPDLVLLDVEMPEFSGFEICKAFKRDPALAGVPIIFVTSHESPELETAGLRLGAADFISKPPHASLVLARVRTHQQIKSLSDTVRSAVTMDFLTGASSRRQFEKTLTQEWLRAQTLREPLALLLADIVGFSAINAEYGEETGDACLRAVADGLRALARRPADLVARHAGGSFTVLLPSTDAAAAATFARRVLETVATTSMACGGREIDLQLCLGGAFSAFAPSGEFNAADGTPADLIAAAEGAVQRAKSTRRTPLEIIDLADIAHPKELRRGLGS